MLISSAWFSLVHGCFFWHLHNLSQFDCLRLAVCISQQSLKLVYIYSSFRDSPPLSFSPSLSCKFAITLAWSERCWSSSESRASHALMLLYASEMLLSSSSSASVLWFTLSISLSLTVYCWHVSQKDRVMAVWMNSSMHALNSIGSIERFRFWLLLFFILEKPRKKTVVGGGTRKEGG